MIGCIPQAPISLSSGKLGVVRSGHSVCYHGKARCTVNSEAIYVHAVFLLHPFAFPCTPQGNYHKLGSNVCTLY